jgi:secretion/DNA translocation related TadE-like protein
VTEDARSQDVGSATVWLLIGCVLLCATTVGLLQVGAAMVARHRAAAAADLAALAAARVLASAGSIATTAAAVDTSPCAAAALVAGAQGARLTACVTQGDVVEVVTEVRPPALLIGLPPARARARSGPTTEGP